MYNIVRYKSLLSDMSEFTIEPINDKIKHTLSYALELCLTHNKSDFEKIILAKSDDIQSLSDKVEKLRTAHNKYRDDFIFNYTKNEFGDTSTKSKKYSYVYVVKNSVNDKVYVGAHTTDNINDGYLGSSRPFLKEIDELGKDKFSRTIIQFFNNHEDAKDYERNLLELLFRDNSHRLYNRNILGTGGNYGEEVNKKISESHKKNWELNGEELTKKIHTEEANLKRGESISQWIQDNPEAHKERMDKINKNPEKIAKSAEKHRGMKREESSKAKMSETRRKKLENATPEEMANLTGLGKKMVTNILTYENKRVDGDYVLQENEVFGVKKDPKIPFKKASVVTNIITWQEKKVDAGYVMSENERKGNKKIVRSMLK